MHGLTQAYGFDVRLAGGGQTRTPGHVPLLRSPSVSRAPDLDASADLVAASVISIDNQGPGTPTGAPADTYSWPTTQGPGAHSGACSATVNAGPFLNLLAVQGFEVLSCSEDHQSVIIYDGRNGSVISQIPAQDPLGFRLAGRLVAWLERGSGTTFVLVVYDRDRTSEVMRLPTQALGEQLRSWDLQADGTVAYSVQDPDGRQRVGWTSVTDPTPHVAALTPSAGYDVRIADGVIAFRRGRGPQGVLGVVPLNGVARIVARGVSNGFDFDGRQAAFAFRACETNVIERADVIGPVYRAPFPRQCALHLTQRVRLSRDASRATVRLRCNVVISGCSGPARLRELRGRRPGHVIGRGTISSALGFLRVSRSAAARLRAGATLRARLTVQLDADPEHPAGRSRTVLLRSA